MVLRRLLRAYLRSGLRGQTRLTSLLARRFKALQAVPVSIADCPPLYVDLRDGLGHHLLRGDPWNLAPWESEEQDVMRRVVRPGDTVFDVGANMGLHSVLLARLVGPNGRLDAFEPNAEMHQALGRTFSGLANASLHPVALSNESTDSARLFHPGDHLKVSLADWTAAFGVESRRLTCAVQTIDNLLEQRQLSPPDFIKCDVEGAELRVFQGAQKVLDRRRAPIILFEANVHTAAGFGLGVSSVKEFLQELRPPQYRFFQVAPDPVLPPVEEITSPHSNILAVPETRLTRLGELTR
jgi:FkbM family methyltransferase